MRNRAENKITLAIIRHGETQANKERRYLGRTDEALSERGTEILKSYKMQNLYPEVECLFTSPMKRCTGTAEIIYPGLCPVVIPEWEEINFGRFEYRNYEELKDDAQYQSWLQSGGTLDFPEGESRKDFIRRCRSGFIRMCSKLRQAESVFAGMIVHGGTIMSLLSLYGGNDYFDCQVSNGRGYICSLTGANGGTDNIQIKVTAEI